MQTPAGQAQFELSRPRARFVQPILIAGFIAVYPVLMIAPLAPLVGLGIGAAIMATATAYSFRRRRRELREAAGRVLNSAFNLIGLGRLREASEVLDVVESRVREPWCLRLIEIQRAIVATRKGDMPAARKALDDAIAQPLQPYARENAAYQLEGAHALRAFVRASLGDEQGARADIDTIRGAPASDDALARVTLAEALLLEKAGKREELRLLLAERGGLLLEHTHPRERAIVRAFQRMVRSDKSSVYRRAEARRSAQESEEPTLADWVAKVAPGAASFVRSTRPAQEAARMQPQQAVSTPTFQALRANQEAKKPQSPNLAKWAILGTAGTVAVVSAISAIAANISTTTVNVGPDRVDQTSGVFPFLMLPILAFPVIYGVTRLLAWIGRARAEAAARSPRNAASSPPNDEQLKGLTSSPSPVVAAQAWLLLADRAERRGAFEEALEATTTGLTRLARPGDRLAADIVYPDLVSLRAFCLSALGRYEESNAELASLGPAYPHYGRAVFRAGLLAYLKRGELKNAAAWIDQGEADLPLSVREELLADLVRATVEPEQAGAGEIQRLKDELAASPEIKTWIRTLAPKLLDTFDRATVADVPMRIDSASAFGPAAFGSAVDSAADSSADSPANSDADSLAAAPVEEDHLAEEEAQAALEPDRSPRVAR